MRGVRPPEGPSLDLRIIQEFGNDVLASAGVDQAKNLAIGLLNTHFAILKTAGYQRCLIEDFLYLLYAYLVSSSTPGTELQELVLELSQKALRGKPRAAPASSFEARRSFNFLLQNKIRI